MIYGLVVNATMLVFAAGRNIGAAHVWRQ